MNTDCKCIGPHVDPCVYAPAEVAEDTCGCADCLDNENGCSFDCDPGGGMCAGCLEESQAQDEIGHAIDVAQGRL